MEPVLVALAFLLVSMPLGTVGNEKDRQTEREREREREREEKSERRNIKNFIRTATHKMCVIIICRLESKHEESRCVVRILTVYAVMLTPVDSYKATKIRKQTNCSYYLSHFYYRVSLIHPRFIHISNTLFIVKRES